MPPGIRGIPVKKGPLYKKGPPFIPESGKGGAFLKTIGLLGGKSPPQAKKMGILECFKGFRSVLSNKKSDKMKRECILGAAGANFFACGAKNSDF